MPNIGRPSRDCYECRQKRTKCDLKRPACGQCVRKNQPCSGYRKEIEFRFRVESVTSFPSNMSKDRRRNNIIQEESSNNPLTLAEAPGRKRDTSYCGREHELLLQQHVRLPIHKSLKQSWDVQAIPFYMKCIKPAYDLAKGIYWVVPRIISSEGPYSAVYYASSAVASGYLAHTIQSTEVKLLRTKFYGAAIRAVKMALYDFHQSRTDGTLLAIFSLGYYELLLNLKKAATSVVVSSEWLAHNQVITELMRRRGPEQFATVEGRNLFLVLFSNMEMQAFMTSRQWEDANTWIASFYKYCDPSEYPMLRACIFCHHCSVICGRIQALLNASDLDDLRSNVASILQDVYQVETAIYPLQLSDPIVQTIMAEYAIEPPSPLYPTHHTSPRRQRNPECEVLQRIFRMRLSYHVLKLLRHACRAPSCSPQEYVAYKTKKTQCVDEIHSLAFELLLLVNPEFPISQNNAERKENPKTKDNDPGGNYSISDVKRYVKVCVDLDLDSDDKCTLLFNHTEDGISVLGLSFGDEREVDS